MKMLLFLSLLLAVAHAEPGIPVGAVIPKFELRDQSGRKQTLDSIKGPKGAMIVFYRSADW